jgi:hypothetical protein
MGAGGTPPLARLTGDAGHFPPGECVEFGGCHTVVRGVAGIQGAPYGAPIIFEYWLVGIYTIMFTLSGANVIKTCSPYRINSHSESIKNPFRLSVILTYSRYKRGSNPSGIRKGGD